MSQTLFTPFTAGDITLANRIVMAPLTRNRSPNAIPNDLNVLYYSQRATAGLIISEATAISHQGQGYANVPGLYAPEQIEGWKKVTDAVHTQGGKIVTQLWHVGRISHHRLQPDEGAPVAPSAIQAEAKTYLVEADGQGHFEPTSAPRALTLEEIPGIVQDYVKAAAAAIKAGFDGVEIHAANGYLIDQFLKTGANQRTDAYGGSIENRARFLLEVVQAITHEIGAGKTGIRLSPVTPANGIVDADPQPLFTYVLQKLTAFPLAYIHIIEGATGGPRELQDRPFDYDAARQAYQQAGGKAAWMVNNSYDKDYAEAVLNAGKADLVAFGRPFIANPDLVARFAQNAPLNAPDPKRLYGGGDAAGYTDYPSLQQTSGQSNG
ncbi:alkene reductase [Lampropedia puyangensis]|uniref:Alkene reductase n=1 Tax=Lampropedia puyangensis TaxID=1330072 RepID=A0A4S8EPY8_9BURK|nr:alkene reductase [Lampropedia puyangensis]THT96396.1 alkene reductase [Lampropedia puyangensis]